MSLTALDYCVDTIKRVFIKNLSTPMSRNRAESIFAQGRCSWNTQVFEVCWWSPGRKKTLYFFNCTTKQNREGKPGTKSVSQMGECFFLINWIYNLWGFVSQVSGLMTLSCIACEFLPGTNRFNVIVNDYMHANFWICHFRFRYKRILGRMPPK